MLHSYRSVLTTPGVLIPLLASFAGAALIGMLNLAVLLAVRLQTGSFPLAGVVVAALGVGNAIGIVIQGGLIDRHGQTPVLISASAACMAALFGLVVMLASRSHLEAILVGLAFVAGAAVPATPSSIRVLVADLITEPHIRVSGYALIAVTFTLAGVIAPMLVSACLFVVGPTAAVALCSLVAGLTGTIFAATRASRRWRPPATRTSRRVVPLRPNGIATAGMRSLVAANLLIGLTTGLINVGVPALMIAYGKPALAGVLFSCLAVGDLAGGAAYGIRNWRADLSRRLLVAQIAALIAVAAMAAIASSILMTAVTLSLIGVAGSVRGITMSALLDRVALPQAATESYASMISSSLLGGSLGSAIGGAAIGKYGDHAALDVAAISACLAAAWILLRLRSLRPPTAQQSTAR